MTNVLFIEMASIPEFSKKRISLSRIPQQLSVTVVAALCVHEHFPIVVFRVTETQIIRNAFEKYKTILQGLSCKRTEPCFPWMCNNLIIYSKRTCDP